MKKVYTAAFKAQVTRELLKETKTIPQLAAAFGVAPTVLRDWRAVALKGFPDLFTARDSLAALQAAHDQQVETLYGEIGRRTTQLHVRKKRLPRSAIPSGVPRLRSALMRCRSRSKPNCAGSVAAAATPGRNRHRRRRWRSNSGSTSGTPRILFMARAR